MFLDEPPMVRAKYLEEGYVRLCMKKAEEEADLAGEPFDRQAGLWALCKFAEDDGDTFLRMWPCSA